MSGHLLQLRRLSESLKEPDDPDVLTEQCFGVVVSLWRRWRFGAPVRLGVPTDLSQLLRNVAFMVQHSGVQPLHERIMCKLTVMFHEVDACSLRPVLSAKSPTRRNGPKDMDRAFARRPYAQPLPNSLKNHLDGAVYDVLPVRQRRST